MNSVLVCFGLNRMCMELHAAVSCQGMVQGGRFIMFDSACTSLIFAPSTKFRIVRPICRTNKN